MTGRFLCGLLGVTARRATPLVLVLFALLTSEQSAIAESRTKSAQVAQRCALGEAKAEALAAKLGITVAAPAQISLLDTFEIKIAAPVFAGNDRDRGLVTITFGLSPAAGAEAVKGDVDIFEPGQRLEKSHTEIGFGIRTFEDMRRMIVRVDPMWGGAEVRINVRAWALGRLQLKWTVSGSAIGCAARQFVPVQERTIEVVPDRREQVLRSSNSCADEEGVLKSIADGVSVSVQGANRLSVGDEITVKWDRGEINFLRSRPVYLIFSMPEEVRFAGRDLIAVPLDARAPAEISYGRDRLRAFVPLHMLGTPRASAFKIKPYAIGTLAVDYAIVAKTGCGERVLIRGSKKEFEVEHGRHEIVIQDFFTFEKPEKVFTSASGRHRLEIYKGHYKVFDITNAGNGAKIMERSGRNPNFSPTGRFIAAQAGNSNEDESGQMEIFDLMAGRLVAFQLSGPILGWALRDALLIEGTYPRGELKVRYSLIDPMNAGGTSKEESDNLIIPTTEVTNRDVSAWESLGVILDINHGIAVLYNEGGFPTLWELASGQQWKVSRKQLALLLAHYGVTTFERSTVWDAGEPLRLSHYSPLVDKQLPKLAKNRTVPKQKGYLFEQTPTYLQAGNTSILPNLSSLDWRAKPVVQAGKPVLPRAPSFIERLSSFGFHLDQEDAIEALVIETKWITDGSFVRAHSPKFRTSAESVEEALLKDIPAADKLLNTLTPNLAQRLRQEPLALYSNRRVPCSGPDDDKSFDNVWRFKEHAHGVWTWSIGEKKYWLVQMLCFWKGAPFTNLYLFERGTTGNVAIRDLFQPLLKGTSASDSDELTRVRPFLISDRWLMLGSAGSKAVALVDLNERSAVVYLHGLRNASALSKLYLSKDRGFVVQLNTDGSLYVYRRSDGIVWTAARKREFDSAAGKPDPFRTAPMVTAGRWIDEEILLFTAEGYYWGSYEATHFVHLRLPGVAGVHPIAQFASLLSRPDIVQAAIKGVAPPPAPKLNVPPEISLEVKRSANHKLLVSISAWAATSLRAVRIYIDGQSLPDISLRGARDSIEKELDYPPNARWLTAVAIDQFEFISTPVSRALQPQGPSHSQLLGVVVGVDTYAESKLVLQYAKSDAARVKAALDANLAGYYGKGMIHLTPLLDADATADKIELELKKAIANASKGDTVLFFFSGHGLQGGDQHLYLTSSGFRSSDPAGTGLSWSRIASVLLNSEARIIVVLDACHSGLSGIESFATNDDFARAQSDFKSPMVILAASKGRQIAYEGEKWKGGVFSFALESLLLEPSGDVQKGARRVLDVSALYSRLKELVAHETENDPRGVQTPWLERKNVLGDFGLF